MISVAAVVVAAVVVDVVVVVARGCCVTNSFKTLYSKVKVTSFFSFEKKFFRISKLSQVLGLLDPNVNFGFKDCSADIRTKAKGFD